MTTTAIDEKIDRILAERRRALRELFAANADLNGWSDAEEWLEATLDKITDHALRDWNEANRLRDIYYKNLRSSKP